MTPAGGAGPRLAAAGVLAAAEEVFHLRLEELDWLADPVSLPAAQARRIRWTIDNRPSWRREFSGVPLVSPAALFPSDGDARLDDHGGRAAEHRTR